MVSRFQARTDAKLEYARIHLEEITSRQEIGSGDAFERAHEESFLFHFIGAKDYFLQEINVAYEIGLSIRQVRESRLQSVLEAKAVASPALNTIVKLKSDKTSWLAVAIELRDHGTHRSNIPRLFHARSFKEKGYEYKDKVFFTNLLTGQPIETDIPEFLKQCLKNMEILLQELRPTLPQESAGDV